ncbi:SGNH/GDSL hydrolase family protein [Candidatus Omnitrophota bacterium]
MTKMLNGVICFGDSVIFGTGASSRSCGCGRVLRSLLQVPVLIKGRNNDTSRDGLRRLRSDVLNRDGYSHVIILFGNNDCRLFDVDTPNIDSRKYKENIIKMIHAIKEKGKDPFISNLQPITSSGFTKSLPQMKQLMKNIKSPSDWHKSYSDALKEIAQVCNVKLVDIFNVLKSRMPNVICEDGLHPNDLGHKIIAEEFKKALVK